jgi:hypothetical protein
MIRPISPKVGAEDRSGRILLLIIRHETVKGESASIELKNFGRPHAQEFCHSGDRSHDNHVSNTIVLTKH